MQWTIAVRKLHNLHQLVSRWYRQVASKMSAETATQVVYFHTSSEKSLKKNKM